MCCSIKLELCSFFCWQRYYIEKNTHTALMGVLWLQMSCSLFFLKKNLCLETCPTVVSYCWNWPRLCVYILWELNIFVILIYVPQILSPLSSLLGSASQVWLIISEGLMQTSFRTPSFELLGMLEMQHISSVTELWALVHIHACTLICKISARILRIWVNTVFFVNSNRPSLCIENQENKTHSCGPFHHKAYVMWYIEKGWNCI